MSGKQEDTVPLSPKGHEAPPAYSTQPATVVVTQPHVTTPGVYGGAPPKDYLVLSMFTLFFCCMPLGLIVLIKSMEVRSAITRGDYVAAEVASRSALQFNKISLIVGVIIIVISIVFSLLAQLSWIIPLAIGAYDHHD